MGYIMCTAWHRLNCVPLKNNHMKSNILKSSIKECVVLGNNDLTEVFKLKRGHLDGSKFNITDELIRTYIQKDATRT